MNATSTGSPVENIRHAITSQGGKSKSTGKGRYLLSCPVPSHGKGNGDTRPSLSLTEGDQKEALIYCHSGCNTDDVLGSLGLTTKDMFMPKEVRDFHEFLPKLKPITIQAAPAPQPAPTPCTTTSCTGIRKTQKLGECVAQYIYTDADQVTVGVVHRYEPKDFRPFTFGQDGKLVPGGKIDVPYGLHKAIQVLSKSGLVLICEGEKDADAVNALGRDDLAGVTNAFGAKSWNESHAKFFQGLGGVIQAVGDTDAAGQEHVKAIVESFNGLRNDPVIVSWPAAGNDLSDHLHAGLGIDDLRIDSPIELPEALDYPRLGNALSISDLDNFPAIRPLVKGWLSVPSASVLVGAYGTGKTALTVALACSVASGTDFLGCEVEQRNTLYVVGEGVRGFSKRLRAWSTTWKQELPADSLKFLASPPGSLTEASFWSDLLRYCLAENVGFVVLDTMSALAPDADETKDAPKIVRGLNDLASAINGTVLLVHHPGWSNAGRSRGGYQLQGNVDEVLVLTSASEGSDHLAVKLDKVKDGESGHTHYLKRITVPLGIGKDGQPESSITVEHSRISDTETPIRKRIIEYLSTGDMPASPKDIADKIGTDRAHRGFRQALTQLKNAGVIEATGNGRSTNYRLIHEGNPL